MDIMYLSGIILFCGLMVALGLGCNKLSLRQGARK